MTNFSLKHLLTLGLRKQTVPSYGQTSDKSYPQSIPLALVALCFLNSLVKLAIPLVLEETYSSISILSNDSTSYVVLIALVIGSIALSQLLTIAYVLVLTLYRLNVKRELSVRILKNNFRDYCKLLQSRQIEEQTVDYNMELRIKISTKLSVYLHNYYQSYLNLVFECFNIAVIFVYLLYKLSFSLFFGVAIAAIVMASTIKIANSINKIKFQNIDRRARRLKILETFFGRVTQFKMCWLDHWVYRKVKKLQEQYQSGLRAIKMLDCWCVALWQFTSVGISSVVIAAYFLLGLNHNQESVFSPSTFVYLLNMLNLPLNALSWYIAGIRTAEQAIKQIKQDVRNETQSEPDFTRIQEEKDSYVIVKPIRLVVEGKSKTSKFINIPVQELPKSKIYSVSGPYSEVFMDKLLFLVDQKVQRGFVEENGWLSESAIQSIAMQHTYSGIKKNEQQQIVKLLELFSCGDIPLTSATSNYSGGEKLRVSLARAFHLGEFIVINSDLSSLDGKTRELVRGSIRKLVDGTFPEMKRKYTVFIRDSPKLADCYVTLKEQTAEIDVSFSFQQTFRPSQISQISLSPEIAKYSQQLTILIQSNRQKSEKLSRRYSVDKLQKLDIKEESVVSWSTFKIYYQSKKHLIFLAAIIVVTSLSNYYNYYISTYLSLAEYHPHQLATIAALTALFALGLFFRSYYFADANLDESLRICHTLNKHIILNQLSEYNSNPTHSEPEENAPNSKAQLVCVLTSDSETISDHFPFSTNIFANNVVVILSSMVVIAWEVPSMLLLMGLLVIYANRLNHQSHRKDQFLKRAMKEKDVDIYHIMSEIEEGKKYVLIHRKLDSFVAAFAQQQEELYALDWLNQKFKNYVNFKYKTVMVGFLTVAVLLYSFVNVFDKQSELASADRKASSGLALLIQYTTQLSNYLLFFTMSIWQIKGQAVSIERAKPFLEETSSIRQRIASSQKTIEKIKHSSNHISQGDTLLQLKSLTFAYENNFKVKIFDNLNFEIRKGDKIIIRGKSGVGKTTLYKLLTSTYPDIFSSIDSSVFVAFSPQHPLVLPDAPTVQQNLNPYQIAFPEEEIRQQLEKWGLRRQQAMSQLTYEQKIVVNNLRAYLQGRKGVILYDEPQEVISNQGQSQVIVTHHREFPCSRKLRMFEGGLMDDSDSA